MHAPSRHEQAASRRAILFADLVESVRLYERFEASTIERWRAFSARVREQVAPAFGGRLVRTVGDGLLMDMGDAAAAVQTALALHAEIAHFNVGAPPEAHMLLRVGLHVADVVVDEQDLWGSGVNLAARLATLAQPAQTVASLAARAGLVDGVHAGIHDLGLRYMKHLAEPVRAFVLQQPGAHDARALHSTEDLRPALAVVPFVALPADATHDAIGYAMADDIIASLARHPGLRVQSRASTASVRGQALPLERLRELLGASFMLSGHFYTRGSRVRLSVELSELTQGRVLWADHLHGDVDALFEGQDDMVPHLVAQVSQQVLAHELARVRSLPMDSLASYSLLLGAGGLLHSMQDDQFGRARPILEHLIDRHPRQASPHAMMSGWHIVKMVQGWTADAQHDSEQALAHARQAMDRDPSLPEARVAMGMSMVFSRRDFQAAGEHYRAALEHSPNHAEAWARLSETLSEAGQHDEALDAATRAIACSPLDPQRYAFESFAARAAYVAGRYPRASQHAREAIRRHALHAPAHRLLVASLWQDDQPEAARRAAGDYLRLMPGARAASGASRTQTPFVLALHSAGLPL